MDFSGAGEWWVEWQLQVLLLASLVNQFFLVISGGLRRHPTGPCFRLFIWLSFLASNSVALSALATPMLQWRLQQYISPQRNHDLEVLWAPVLLMHLGGQRCISAYNLEDNELWKRQGLETLTKVIFAVYVFSKTWSPSADNRLLAAAILLFISGVVKCGDRILCLKSSSFQSLSDFVNEAEGSTRTGRVLGLDEYVRSARAFFLSGEANNIAPAFPPNMPAHLPQKLFVDFSHSYSDRLVSLKSFWALDEEQTYKVLRSGLTHTFELLYTQTHAPLIGNSRAPIQYFYATLGSATFLPLVATLLFHISNKQAYRGVDVAVTFVLLYGTVAAEIISVWLTLRSRNMWPDMIAQQNIFRYFAHSKKHSKLMAFADWFNCKDFIDTYWCMDPCYDSRHITRVIRTHTNLVWTDFIKQPHSYIGYTNNRGQWILEVMGYSRSLGWSIEKPFDESVIIWHIVTEIICYLRRNDMPLGLSRCREMSNYMIHLLFAESEMLLPGSRKGIFTAACNQLSVILGADEGPWDDADGLVLKVINKVITGGFTKEASSFRDAWRVLKGLLDLGQGPMYVTIQSIWVEMLCFSAGRCRGYLHAKSLGSSGGEYLSFVSLLLAYTGMPTLADTLQTACPFHPSMGENFADAALVLELGATMIPSCPGLEEEAAQIIAALSVEASEAVPEGAELDQVVVATQMTAALSVDASEAVPEGPELDQVVVEPEARAPAALLPSVRLRSEIVGAASLRSPS